MSKNEELNSNLTFEKESRKTEQKASFLATCSGIRELRMK